MRFPTISDGTAYFAVYSVGCDLLHRDRFWPAFRFGLVGLLMKLHGETVEAMYEIPFQAVRRAASPTSPGVPPDTLMWEFWEPIRLARQQAVEGIRPSGSLPQHLAERFNMWIPIWMNVKGSSEHWQQVVRRNPEGVFGTSADVENLMKAISPVVEATDPNRSGIPRERSLQTAGSIANGKDVACSNPVAVHRGFSKTMGI